jgi:hypothetical protein
MSATKEDMFENALIIEYSDLHMIIPSTIDYDEAQEFYDRDSTFRRKVDKRFSEILKLAEHYYKK